MAINPIDISFLVVLIYGISQGLKKGFIGTLLSIAKFVVTLFIALRFSFIFSRVLDKFFIGGNSFTPILAFIILIIMVGGFFYFIGNTLEQFMKAAHLSQLNRSLGIFLWVIALIIGYSTVISMSDSSGLLADWVKNTSYVYPYIEPFSDVASCKLSEIFPAIQKIMQSLLAVIEGLVGAIVGSCGIR
ncbi:MAG: CvpA family protein [Chitinophagales bacterium]